MADKRAEILELYLPTPEGHPDTQAIYNAMDENGKRLCLELLEYMANNNITCSILFDEPRFYYNGQYLTKELLFENFL